MLFCKVASSPNRSSKKSTMQYHFFQQPKLCLHEFYQLFISLAWYTLLPQQLIYFESVHVEAMIQLWNGCTQRRGPIVFLVARTAPEPPCLAVLQSTQPPPVKLCYSMSFPNSVLNFMYMGLYLRNTRSSFNKCKQLSVSTLSTLRWHG